MTTKPITIGTNELRITKPVSTWNRDIHVSPKDLLRGIGKMALKGASLDWTGVGESALDTLDASGFQKEPGEIAWLLIYRALISAISKLSHEYLDLYENPPDEKKLEEISSLFEQEMERLDVTIDLDFFQKPGDLKLLKALLNPLAKWMSGLGIAETNAVKICSRLPDYFEISLHEKWRSSPEDYVTLKDFFETPFTKATEESRSWTLYNRWLKRQISDRMFAEPFGVEEVYVPLRAYYEKKKDNAGKALDPHASEETTLRIVFDLERDFREWLNNYSQDTAVRFISGGPGSGKSTFAKVLASRVANETNIPTLYIPLHLFDATDNLISAMGKFIEGNRFLSGNPLDAKQGKARLFVIFDGLDELALQGKAAAEVANEFVDEVLRRIQQGNSQGLQRQVMISGRSISIQSVANKLRESKQVCHVLPYLVKESDKYSDPENILSEDQRNRWWSLYGKASSKNYSTIPAELNRSSLEEITAQPLLNYLVALSYDRKRIKFADDTTLNQIYADLISEVYSRQYEGGRVSACVGDLKEIEFVRVLEEIALAIWHGDGRIATVSNIQEKCKSGGISKYLDSFKEGAKSGVTRLLTAFYFRQSESRGGGDPSFEFTHKSFGEYLTALRIMRGLRQIQIQRERENANPGDGWSIKVALERWTDLCSPTAIDPDLMNYLNNEFRKIDNKDLIQLQSLACELLTYTINQGLPFSLDYASMGFKQHLRLARNAEEALLGVHFSIASVTKKQISKLELESESSFGEWISRLRGQRQGPTNTLALYSLGFLDLSGYIFHIQDFYRANFEFSCLVDTEFQLASLQMANFQGANLQRTKFYEANLQGAELREANLQDAKLQDANLQGAEIQGANLQGADLKNAALKNADLKNADLKNADLKGAKLHKAKLQDANLQGANLQGANLQGANLQGANLQGAKLLGAIFRGANLQEVNLQEADTKGANLQGAILDDAKMKAAQAVTTKK